MSVNKGSLAVISSSSNHIEVFGITNDKTRLGHISFNGSAWSTWSLLGLSGGLLYKTAPSAVSTIPGTFEVFASDTGDHLMTRHFNGTSWRPDIGWQLVDNGIAESGYPLAMKPLWPPAEDRWDLCSRRTDGYTVTYYNTANPSQFGYNTFRKYIKSPAVTIISGSGSMERFWIGLDDRVYHAHWVEGPFSRWEDNGVIGGQKITSPLTAVSNAPGRVDVFGLASNQTVMHNSYQNTSNTWTGWEQLGSSRFTSAISAIIPQGTKQIELYGRGEDGAFWHRYGNGSHWPVSWDSHKGNFTSAPALISASDGSYDVFGIGTDGTVKHAHHLEVPDTWTPGYQAWNSLGGSWQTFE